MNKKQAKGYNSHLTLEERIVIQTGIESGAKKIDIAKTLNKDASTIIKDNSTHVVYLGSKLKEVHEYFDKMAGKKTILFEE